MGIKEMLADVFDAGYEDRQNNRISVDVMAALMDIPDYQQIAHSHIAEFCISTVWIGVYTSTFGGPFETIIYDKYTDTLVEMRRYRKEGNALVDHMMAVASCRVACYQLMPGPNRGFPTPHDDVDERMFADYSFMDSSRQWSSDFVQKGLEKS